MIFLLQEYESVSFAHLNHLTSLTNSISLSTNGQQRVFDYHLVARQCDYNWTSYRILSTTTNSVITVNSNLCAPINFPSLDTTVSEDSGWRILRIVLFSLLGVAVACTAALIAFFVIR